MSHASASAAVRPRRGSGAPRRRRAMVYLVELLLCLGFLAGFGHMFSAYVYESDRFMVKHVRLEGQSVLAEETLLEVADIRSNHNLLLTECEEIRQRIEGIPYVQTAEVQRMYPDTIVIRLTERQPVLLLLLNNHLYEIDEEGVVLRELKTLEADSLPLISGVAGLISLEPGERLEQPALAETLKLWKAFRQVPLARELKVSEFLAAAPNDITMVCEDLPFVIRWGRSDYLEQAQRLEVWWRQVGHPHPCLEYLDLRFGSGLVCK